MSVKQNPFPNRETPKPCSRATQCIVSQSLVSLSPRKQMYGPIARSMNEADVHNQPVVRMQSYKYARGHHGIRTRKKATGQIKIRRRS